MTRKTRILFAAATAVCMQMAVAAGPTVDTATIESVTGLKAPTRPRTSSRSASRAMT